MIIYLIIISDMLVGAAPEFGGVLPAMLGRHDNPWWLSRAFVVSPPPPLLMPALAHQFAGALLRAFCCGEQLCGGVPPVPL